MSRIEVCGQSTIAGFSLKPPSHADEWIPLVSGSGDADVHAGVHLHVLGECIIQAAVKCAQPARAALRSHFAVEFHVAIKLSVNLARERDAVVKLRTVAGFIEVAHGGKSSR